MAVTYDQAQLRAKYIASWEEDDLSVFSYPPRWQERFVGTNDTTRLILDFKQGNAVAIGEVARWAKSAFQLHLEAIEDEHGIRHVVAAPRSGAGVVNVGCEAVAEALASRFGFLQYHRGALIRTESVPQAHRGTRLSTDGHLATLRWTGPPIGPGKPCGVLVIDDVTTTGSTLEACRAVIRDSTSASGVVGFAIGRTRG